MSCSGVLARHHSYKRSYHTGVCLYAYAAIVVGAPSCVGGDTCRRWQTPGPMQSAFVRGLRHAGAHGNAPRPAGRRTASGPSMTLAQPLRRLVRGGRLRQPHEGPRLPRTRASRRSLTVWRNRDTPAESGLDPLPFLRPHHSFPHNRPSSRQSDGSQNVRPIRGISDRRGARFGRDGRCGQRADTGNQLIPLRRGRFTAPH